MVTLCSFNCTFQFYNALKSSPIFGTGNVNRIDVGGVVVRCEIISDRIVEVMHRIRARVLDRRLKDVRVGAVVDDGGSFIVKISFNQIPQFILLY